MMNRIRNKFELREILRFLVGGGSAVLVDFIVYTVLKKGMDVSVAKAVSYVAGAAVGFVINKYWTFESKSPCYNEIVKYILLYSCSAVMNTLVNKLALYLSSGILFAFLCATGTSTLINFLGQKFFVFSGGKDGNNR